MGMARHQVEYDVTGNELSNIYLETYGDEPRWGDTLFVDVRSYAGTEWVETEFENDGEDIWVEAGSCG